MTDLFADFVASCAFLHDDWNPLLGEDDWDQFDTNPFLLGARVCVVTTLEGFGEGYLDYLRGLDCLPEIILQPRRSAQDLCESLLQDADTLARLRAVVAERRLDLSTFYSFENGALDRLAAALGGNGHVPAIVPPPAAFCRADDKAEARQLFGEAGVPFPEGRLCTTPEDLLRFASELGGDARLLIKSGHRDLMEIAGHAELLARAPSLAFPLLAEKRYDFRSSPVCHFLAWRGRREHLFTVDQLLRDWHHAGNQTPAALDAATEAKIVGYTQRILERMPAFAGALVVDYILTDDGEALAVDLNPRFGASTYPFFLLHRLGLSPRDTFARSRICRRSVPDLSALFADRRFPAFNKQTGRGILLFNPVVDLEQKALRHFSYLAVGAGVEDLDGLEAELDEILPASPCIR